MEDCERDVKWSWDEGPIRLSICAYLMSARASSDVLVDHPSCSTLDHCVWQIVWVRLKCNGILTRA